MHVQCMPKASRDFSTIIMICFHACQALRSISVLTLSNPLSRLPLPPPRGCSCCPLVFLRELPHPRLSPCKPLLPFSFPLPLPASLQARVSRTSCLFYSSSTLRLAFCVRRSKAGGLQPLVAMAAWYVRAGCRRIHPFFYLSFSVPPLPPLNHPSRTSTRREFNPRAFRGGPPIFIGKFGAFYVSDCMCMAATAMKSRQRVRTRLLLLLT